MRLLPRLTLAAAVLALAGTGCGDSKPDNSAIQTPPGQRLDPPASTGGGKDAQQGASRKR